MTVRYNLGCTNVFRSSLVCFVQRPDFSSFFLRFLFCCFVVVLVFFFVAWRSLRTVSDAIVAYTRFITPVEFNKCFANVLSPSIEILMISNENFKHKQFEWRTTCLTSQLNGTFYNITHLVFIPQLICFAFQF